MLHSTSNTKRIFVFNTKNQFIPTFMKTAFFAIILLLVGISSSCGTNDVPAANDVQKDTTDYQAKGLEFATQAKNTLGKNLVNAINTQGTENALSFCSTRAIALTDSVAASLDVKLKRVSDKNRNPQNAANSDELNFIESLKKALVKGEKLKPLVNENGTTVTAYYPILTDQLCMQCHGETTTDISPATMTKLKTIYPTDLATGYSINEVRGIWVVEMKK